VDTRSWWQRPGVAGGLSVFVAAALGRIVWWLIPIAIVGMMILWFRVDRQPITWGRMVYVAVLAVAATYLLHAR
jgi:hypothetical protein